MAAFAHALSVPVHRDGLGASSNPASPSPQTVPPISRNDRRETGPGQNEVPSLIGHIIRKLF
jgi:hypothetical protein